jgi:hypothetical protein
VIVHSITLKRLGEEINTPFPSPLLFFAVSCANANCVNRIR